MATQDLRLRYLIVTASMCLFIGVGAMIRRPPVQTLPVTQTNVDAHYGQQLVKIEQALVALTRELHVKPTREARLEPTRVAVQVTDDASRQALAQMIREEVRHAVAETSPEAQRAKEEALTEAQILNSPGNRAAYHNASSVVQTAVAAKRWTEDDKENFRVAFGLLTNMQRMELVNTLLPAINNGDVKVEVNGPLF